MRLLRRIAILTLAALLTLGCGLAEDMEMPQDELIHGGDMYGEDDTASLEDYPTLQLGDRDDEDGVAYIIFLQNRLIELGYLSDAADGVYGENTRAAVEEFQSRNELPATGVADRTTQERLFSRERGVVAAGPTGGAGTGDIARVQQKLALWGFLSGTVDGRYGDATAAAIVRFKNYVAAVEGEYAPSATPAPPEDDPENPFDMPVPEDVSLEEASEGEGFSGDIDDTLLAFADGDRPFTLVRQGVKKGDSGDEVRRVQTRLYYLGYLYGADGEFGGLTEGALTYFQKKHGLPETGEADEQTQQALFSEAAKKSEEYVFPYKLFVDISDQRVYVLQWNGEEYAHLVRRMKCSTGLNATPTPKGTYQAGGRAGGEWYYFKKYNCYAKWAFRIVGGILFHSVTYSSGKSLNTGSVYNLGHQASHGCVRLSVEDAKWVYDNCPTGVTVVVRD